jgi:NAD(P)H-flavin reductase
MASPLPAEASTAGGPMTPRPFRVAATRQETEDTWTLELEPAGGEPAPAFRPGQFNMLYAFGVGEIPISISGDPAAGGPVEHTVRAVGPASAAICRARPGEQLGVRGPFGSCWPLDGAGGRHVVVVAGGIGLAPLRPALLEALSGRERLESLVLLCGARSPGQLLFRSQLEDWQADPRLEVGVTVDSAEAGWLGNVGVVTTLIERAPFDPARAVAFIVGPEIMMRFAIEALLARGMGASDIYISIERNMKCAVTHCGRCQFGPTFACREGPVMNFAEIERFFRIREL